MKACWNQWRRVSFPFLLLFSNNGKQATIHQSLKLIKRLIGFVGFLSSLFIAGYGLRPSAAEKFHSNQLIDFRFILFAPFPFLKRRRNKWNQLNQKKRLKCELSRKNELLIGQETYNHSRRPPFLEMERGGNQPSFHSSINSHKESKLYFLFCFVNWNEMKLAE